MHHLTERKDIATALGYNNSGQDLRRTLKNHRYEYLVWAALLWITIEFLQFSLEMALKYPSRCALSPIALWPACPAILRMPSQNVSELLIELYSCTGVMGECKHNFLIVYIGRIHR